MLGEFFRRLGRRRRERLYPRGAELAAEGRWAEAVDSALAELRGREPELKLEVLADLAASRDPAILPALVRAADELPDEALPALASLMLGFGEQAYPSLLPIVNRRPAAFPPERLAELLRLAAQRAKR